MALFSITATVFNKMCAYLWNMVFWINPTNSFLTSENKKSLLADGDWPGPEFSAKLLVSRNSQTGPPGVFNRESLDLLVEDFDNLVHKVFVEKEDFEDVVEFFEIELGPEEVLCPLVPVQNQLVAEVTGFWGHCTYLSSLC